MLPLSKQIAVAAVAQSKAPLEVPADANLETSARPIPFDARSTINEGGYVAERRSGPATIERNQCITKSLRLSAPARCRVGRGAWCGQESLELGELPSVGGNVAEILDYEAQNHRRDRAWSTRYGELERAFCGA